MKKSLVAHMLLDEAGYAYHCDFWQQCFIFRYYVIAELICYEFELLQRVDPERTLTDPQRDEFEDMLRGLTLERSLIKEAMGFALDNADAAGEVLPDIRHLISLALPYLMDCLQCVCFFH